MPEEKLKISIRQPNPFVGVLDIQGAITLFNEKILIDAYSQVLIRHLRVIVFNFSQMTYINSLGIGMLVTLLIRARREGVTLVGYGLNQHYSQVFQITRLDQAIPLYGNEATAIAYSAPMDLPEREY